MAEIKPPVETFARIKVVGVGGSGGNAISRMIEAKFKGVEFVAINTDAQDLHHNKAQEKVHVGKNLTKGLGAGMNPDIGRQAAEENRDEIQEVVKGADMVFVTCGLGGGTGSGVAPIVAETAKEMGALTVAVVTKPFSFEGAQRRAIAEEALENLRERVDTLITIPNDKLLQIIDKKTTLINSFKIVDDVLRQGVQGISDLITKPGIVNVDFADVRAIMSNSGSALMGIGIGSGENRAADAAKAAINSPLLELSIDGAKGVLFNVSGSSDLTMLEINEAANIITESIDPNAKVIFGAVVDETIKKGEVQITVVATGFDADKIKESPLEKMSRMAITQSKPIVKVVPQNTPAHNNASFSSHPVHTSQPTRPSYAAPAEPEVDVEESRITFPEKFESKMIIEEKVQPKPTRPAFSAMEKSLEEDDDELEIPAFIRRKMGK
jgi:cell division protein FtsZ